MQLVLLNLHLQTDTSSAANRRSLVAKPVEYRFCRGRPRQVCVHTRMPSSGFSCSSLSSLATLLTTTGERPAPVCKRAEQVKQNVTQSSSQQYLMISRRTRWGAAVKPGDPSRVPVTLRSFHPGKDGRRHADLTIRTRLSRHHTPDGPGRCQI